MSVLPGYQEKKISKKLPKTTIILAIVLTIVLVVVGVYVIGGVGVLADFAVWFTSGAVGIAVWMFTPQFAVGAIVITAIFGLYLYRKSAYAKRKILMPTGSNLPTSDRLATPVFNDNVKVEST